MKRSVIAIVAVVSMILGAALPSTTRPTEIAGAEPPTVSETAPPAGAETLQVQWIKVVAPGHGAMLAAVSRPQGAGPFSTVVLLHGSHGFAREYIQLAQALARQGLLAVAACWFSGGGGAGSRFVSPIICPEAPPRPEASSPAARQRIDALVQAALALPDAHRNGIGLFGHSRGGGAVLNYVLNTHNVRAAVLNSAGYPSRLSDLASQVNVPILLLHGTSDSPADGGAAFTEVQMARDFESALRRFNKPVESMYYQGGGHNSIFVSSTQFNDSVQRMAAFFLCHLGNDSSTH